MPPFTYKADGDILYHTDINDIFTTLESLGVDVDTLEAGVASLVSSVTALTSGKADAVHTHSASDLTATGGTTTSFLRKDNTWATPTNTTYSTISQAEAEDSSSTTARLVTGQRLSQAVLKFAPVKTSDIASLQSGKADKVHSHPVDDITASGTKSSSTYLRGDGTWTTPPNTTYSIPSQAEAEAGTSTTARVWTAQRVSQAIAAQSQTNVSVQNVSVQAVFDGGGEIIPSGTATEVIVPFNGTITGWTIIADNPSSIVTTNILGTDYSSYPTFYPLSPLSERPSLSSGMKNQDLSLTDWTTSVSSGDIIRFVLSSVTAAKRVVISLSMTRS